MDCTRFGGKQQFIKIQLPQQNGQQNQLVALIIQHEPFT